MQKLVTILTPCYNGAKYLPRFLESILNQTYPSIEFIFINDGSTDDTESIFTKYKILFEDKGYKVIYQYQENQGQAAAINNGLKLVTGKYLIWPDSDDALTEHSIEEKVDFLERNPEYGYVRTDGLTFDEKNINVPIEFISKKRKNRFNQYLFEDLISERTYAACGCYMIRISAFDDVNPEREIYTSRGGQNWQMLLPIAYKYKCGYIDSVGYHYIVHDDSHSHFEIKDKGKRLERIYGYEDILINTLKSIPMSENERKKYLDLLEYKYARIRIGLAREFRDKKMFFENYEKLKKIGKIPFKYKLFKLVMKLTKGE